MSSCPRCNNNLTSMQNHNITVDVCDQGCGGIWFDAYELKKMDEAHEADGTFLTMLSQLKIKATPPQDLKLNCLNCENQPMMRHFWSVKRRIEVDECPGCGAYWLDANEFTEIHRQFSTEVERKQAAHTLFDQEFGPQIAKMKLESEEKNKSLRRFANILKYVCPSYYIPGKQDWGAF